MPEKGYTQVSMMYSVTPSDKKSIGEPYVKLDMEDLKISEDM